MAHQQQESLITDPLLRAVLDSAARAREQSLAILDLLDAYHASPSPSPPTTTLEQQLALSAQQKLLTTHLAKLRGLNRQAVFGVRATKVETGERRQEIDGLHLQLQNLYYEERHLRGEIGGCVGFDHRYAHLPLTPREDFLAAHPGFRESSDHDLTIARIGDELQARKALEEQRVLAGMRKAELVMAVGGKREELARLDAGVEKWLAGQEGVRKVFEGREGGAVQV
ncbi:hypothetical protein LTR08_003798 [Meristemomyces frigidus]|nr:hypothetical protein LTR08_003798 [Meristemomyces frigidus]